MLMAAKSKFKKSLRLKTRAFLFKKVNGSTLKHAFAYRY